MLFLYAICFSYAYINLDAGLGALILFAVVQLTIIALALLKKESLTYKKSLGIIIAFLGLLYLLFPSEDFQISIYHAFLMAISGLAWGFYTIFGKSSLNATLNTADNFTKSLLYLALFFVFFVDDLNISSYGVFLAFLSGGITSAIGYLLWYYLVPNMKIATSGVLQLLIPPLAIFLGVLFLDEALTFKLVVSTFVVWKTRVSQDEIMQSSTFDWTRVDNLTNGKARIWSYMFDNQAKSINPANANMAVWEFDPNSTASNYVVNFNGASYVSIDSLKMVASNTTRNYGRIVYFGGSSNNISFGISVCSSLQFLHSLRPSR